MRSVRVLIVDDSVVYRSQISNALALIPGVQIVGRAQNGRVALEKLLTVEVDLITLDFEMPEMNGIELLKTMRDKSIVKNVIMFSAFTRQGADITLEALSLGAMDFVTKPAVGESASADVAPHEKIRALLEPKIALVRQRLESLDVEPRPTEIQQTEFAAVSNVIWDLFKPKVIVIGSSTGGPTALEKIFARLKGPLRCPILIAQHMPPVFTAALAERLSKLSGIPGAEAKNGETLVANRIYVAPGGYHLRLERGEEGVRVALDQGPLLHSVRPAVDHLFTTAASLYGDKCLGFILTGMGEDGRDGAKEIQKNGGAVVIQNKESCVVFGMPGAVFSARAYDKIEDLDQIAKTLQGLAAA